MLNGTLLVVAGALVDANGRVLVQRRPPGKSHAGLWEFPGGKVEPGEGAEAALVRELAEELDVQIDPAALAPVSFASEPPLILLLYRCDRWTGTPRAMPGAAIDWCDPAALADLAMPPADRPLVTALNRALAGPSRSGR